MRTGNGFSQEDLTSAPNQGQSLISLKSPTTGTQRPHLAAKKLKAFHTTPNAPPPSAHPSYSGAIYPQTIPFTQGHGCHLTLVDF